MSWWNSAMHELLERARAYDVTVGPDGEGGFMAAVAQFPGVIAGGDSPEQALQDAYAGIAAVLEVMLRFGDPIPTPEPVLSR